MKFILWCNQEANFQTRTLLIPFDLLPEERRQQLDKIKEHKIKGVPYNVVLVDHTWTYDYDENGKRCGGCGTVSEKDKDLSHLVNIFSYYAEWSRSGILDEQDEDWSNASFIDLCGGFNHVENFKQLCQMKEWEGKPVEIVDSILVLETENGKYKQAPWDTVEQMMRDLYGIHK